MPRRLGPGEPPPGRCPDGFGDTSSSRGHTRRDAPDDCNNTTWSATSSSRTPARRGRSSGPYAPAPRCGMASREPTASSRRSHSQICSPQLRASPLVRRLRLPRLIRRGPRRADPLAAKAAAGRDFVHARRSRVSRGLAGPWARRSSHQSPPLRSNLSRRAPVRKPMPSYEPPRRA